MDTRTHQHHSIKPVTSPPSPTDLKDPVRGMAVTEKSPHKLVRGGRPYYFCSAKCQGKFAANPQQYLAPTPSTETAGR